MNQLTRHIVLVGLMGTGKTTVGEHLARTLGVGWIDIDQTIVKEHRMSVAEMFATAGEEIFREVEHHTLLDALEEPKPHVISTGGGVVIRDDNRELIIEGGWCVWLRGQPETLVDRIGNDIDRPMLGDDAYASLNRLADERGSWYDELADEIIDIDLVTPEDVVTQVLFAARGAGVIK